MVSVAVGDCSVIERQRPPYQTGKTVHVHAKHYKHEDGRTAPGVFGNGSVPLSHSGNVGSRIGIHTHTKPILVERLEILVYAIERRNERTVLKVPRFKKYHVILNQKFPFSDKLKS